MSNAFAFFVLLGFPIFSIVLFRLRPVPEAIVWTLLIGYLFLPTDIGLDAPLLPTVDKTLIPTLSAAVLCFVVVRSGFARRKSRTHREWQAMAGRAPAETADPEPYDSRTKARRRGLASSRAFRLLLLISFVSPIFTVFLNGEKVLAGDHYISGLRPYDIFSFQSELAVAVIPLLLGKWFLRTTEDHLMVLRALCISGLFYSVLMLIEIRLSPQLSKWIYGFFPHSFLQHMRDGGFRPIVFLDHALWVGIFTAVAAMSALVLWRTEKLKGNVVLWFTAAFWLLLVLYLAKTRGALSIAVALFPFLLFFRVRVQVVLALIIASAILFYPMLRGAGYIPVNEIYEFAFSIDVERAESLKFRLDNEDDLLVRVNEKPYFGWGGWGRSEIFDEYGKSVSIADGWWIIIVGTFGWVGYIARLGLLALPIILLAFKSKKLRVGLATSGLCVVLAANLIDLIPNATLAPFTYLISGALMGWYERSSAHSS